MTGDISCHAQRQKWVIDKRSWFSDYVNEMQFVLLVKVAVKGNLKETLNHSYFILVIWMHDCNNSVVSLSSRSIELFWMKQKKIKTSHAHGSNLHSTTPSQSQHDYGPECILSVHITKRKGWVKSKVPKKEATSGVRVNCIVCCQAAGDFVTS